MATTFSIRGLAVSLKGQYDPQFSTRLALLAQITESLSLAYAYGTGAGKAQFLYLEKRGPIAASGNETLTLGSLIQPDGTAFAATKMLAIMALLLPANDDASIGATSLLFGNAALHPWQGFLDDATASWQVRNGTDGGLFVNACSDATGWAIGSGATDQLKVLNQDGAHAATYILGLLGQ